MSSGRTHDRITLWTLPLIALAAFHITLDGWLTALICLGFVLGGLMFGPDLDIHSVQYKRWGCLRWIWLPYRGSMRHRSRWSHGPLLGTVVRVLYFSCWLALMAIVAVDVLNSLEKTALTWGDLSRGVGFSIRTYWPYWLALLIGLELGACSHYTADWLTSQNKSTKRKRTKTRYQKKKSNSRLPDKQTAKNQRKLPPRSGS
jgi:uncharacterized metal-binding protein